MARKHSRSALLGGAAAATAFAVAFSIPAFAGEAEPEQVVITARPPDPVGNAAFSATVLDEQQIQVAPQLDTALRQVPGLSLFRRNSSLSANPTVQGISLRSIGASGAGRALVTLDGVPQNDPFGGWVIWSSLPSEDIQGAEVIRGAGAGPYGAGALTGVVQLTERAGTSGIADIEAGEIGEFRSAAAGNIQVGNYSLGGSALYMTSSGWIPVNDQQRGAADTPLGLQTTSMSIHGGMDILDGTQVTGRFGFYDERRDAGIGQGTSRAKGETGSITVARPETMDRLGWRIQGWYRDTDMANLTYSVGAGRKTATPAGNQYAVPALGWGGNAAVRGTFSFFDWEVGGDVRLNQGVSREFFTFTTGQFRNNRVTGGRTMVGGAYAEGAARFDDWLLTIGGRYDKWQNYHGRIVESVLATGAVTKNQTTKNASGSIPTGRAGIRRNFDEIEDGLYARAAAYEGFRQPTLNELFRGFRVGNNFTLANAALKPEKLYGTEVAVGDDQGAFTWEVAGFWNQLSEAITNRTLLTATKAVTFPDVGLVPAGGQVLQRQNIGDIHAFGVEGDAHWRINDMYSLWGAFNLTDAHVYAGSLAPALTHKRPAQTPRWTVTAGLQATPHPLVTLEAYLVYESLRWSDDLNTLPLGAVGTVNTQITFHVAPHVDLYAAADNVFNVEVGSARGADGVLTIDEPRLFRGGLRYAF